MDIAETQRIILRLFSHNDLDDLAAILANYQVMHFSLSGTKTREQTKLMLDNILLSYQNLRRGLYAVVQKEDRKLIGYCGFFSQKIDGKEEVEVGYRLAPLFWGKGLATESAIATRDLAFNQLRLTRLISIIDPENIRSIRVAEKIGMRHEKDSNFQTVPVRIYAVQKSESPYLIIDGKNF